MKRGFIHYSIVGLVAYVGLCGWLYVTQDSLLYFPSAEIADAPAQIVALQNGDHTLKIWKVGDGSHAVIYFGGNGENVANNIAGFDGLMPDTSVYLVNYRGFGGSTGEPGEAAFYEDAALLYDRVSEAHDRVSLIGRSLGSGVATWLAANRDVYRIVLVTPYDSIENIAKRNYPYAPVSLLLRDKYRSIDRASSITVPILVLLAEKDSIIPHRHAMNLVKEFSEEQVTVKTLPYSTHNTISRAQGYFESMARFLATPGSRRVITEPSVARVSAGHP